jgi:hypothetical protein
VAVVVAAPVVVSVAQAAAVTELVVEDYSVALRNLTSDYVALRLSSTTYFRFDPGSTPSDPAGV